MSVEEIKKRLKVGMFLKYEPSCQVSGLAKIIHMNHKSFYIIDSIDNVYCTDYYKVGSPHESHCWIVKYTETPLWKKLEGLE